MSRVSSAVACLALGAVVITGCKKNEEKKADEKTASGVAADKNAKSRSKAEDQGIEVPTEEDFEETVQAQITVDSDLKKELDDLEKQITQ